jgi:hypothetical protein
VDCYFPNPLLSPESESRSDTYHSFLHLARFARICSKIYNRLYSAAALSVSTADLVPVRDTLENELMIWRDSLPDLFHPLTPFRTSDITRYIHLNQGLFIRFCFFDALCAIHRRFAAPYLSIDRNGYRKDQTTMEAWRKVSVERNTSSAREMALLARAIEVEAYTPSW